MIPKNQNMKVINNSEFSNKSVININLYRQTTRKLSGDLPSLSSDFQVYQTFWQDLKDQR